MTEGYKSLSSTVLEMKFMQKTKRRIEARERRMREAEMKKRCFENEKDEVESKRELLYQFSTDLTYLQGLKFGRMSFKGCNPDVEKLMVYHERKMKGDDSETESEDGKDVGDHEMAKTLRSSTSTNIQRLNSNRKRKQVHPHSTSLDESSGERLNFINIRKRRSDNTWVSSTPAKD